MTSVSIVKIVPLASVLVAACSAALVFGVTQMQHRQTAGTGAITAMMSPPQPAPAVRSEAPPAPAAPPAAAAPETKLAAIAAEPALTPSASATDQSVPSFDIARVEASGDAVIAGRAAPGATVDLLHNGERLDQAVADASGQFVMVPHRLPAGSYELTLSARLPDGTQKSSKQGVSVTINDTGAGSRATEKSAEYAPETTSQASQPTQSRLQATATKPQESADLRSARAVAAGPASDQGASSPAVARGISTRVVSRGDSLWRISRITYGDGTRYALLYRANREQIRDPNLIHPGQILVVPKHR